MNCKSRSLPHQSYAVYSPNRREFAGATGGATLAALPGLPRFDVELVAMAPDGINRSRTYIHLRQDGIPGDATTTGREDEIVVVPSSIAARTPLAPR